MMVTNFFEVDLILKFITLNKDSATGERKITQTYIRSRKKVKAQTFKVLKRNNPSLSGFKED